MHPSELKNQALVAAMMAERDGFTATAEAFKLLATACAAEARDILLGSLLVKERGRPAATQEGTRTVEGIR